MQVEEGLGWAWNWSWSGKMYSCTCYYYFWVFEAWRKDRVASHLAVYEGLVSHNDVYMDVWTYQMHSSERFVSM